jgi:cellulose biosynthesis protein BcsQ
MDIVNSIIQFIESHPALFTGLAAIAAAVGAIGGMLLQYLRNRKERDHLLEELRAAFDREKALASKIGGLESSVNHLTQGNGKLHEKIGALEQLLDLEKIQREVDVTYQEDQRVQRETAIKLAVKKRESDLQLIIKKDRGELEKHTKQQKRWENVLRRTLKAEGEFYASKIRCGTPKFRPIQERQTAIVSVLNLKGGVGKTTVTAHLGAAFAAKGYRVLLLDLDLQGSLSSVYLAQKDIRKHSDEKKLLQDFFGQATLGKKPKLHPYMLPILPGTSSAIVATSDRLSFSEINLTLTWQLRLGSKKDSRFFLRKALHLKQVLNRFDIVLIDCPPLINSCCTNALAASDYVLIPATLSQNSLDRVPKLVSTIGKFVAQVNPSLKIMGAVANRTWAAQLATEEKLLWNMMLNQAKDQLGSPLHSFDTVIRNSKEVREAEDAEDVAFIPPIPGSVLFDTFHKLACEMEERLPLECRRVLAAPQQFQPSAS